MNFDFEHFKQLTSDWTLGTPQLSKPEQGKGAAKLQKGRRPKSIGATTAERRRFSRRVWTAEKRRILRGGAPRRHLARQGRVFWIKVKAPGMIDVFNAQNRVATVNFFADLRANSRRAGVGIIVDLSDVRSIRPTGAVMLLAELDRLFRGQSAGTIRMFAPDDPIVDAVMCQIGIYESARPLAEAERDDVRHWRSASGVASEGEKGGSILEAYEGRLADNLTSDLYAGIVEAMTNTVHHAYAGPQGKDLKRFIGRRWWMLSQERDGELTVAICDLGIGIPRSLPRSSTFSSGAVRKIWRTLGLDNSDASAIRVAVELGRTSTGQKGRGRGLSEIVEAANLSEDGRVLISSNKGVFVSVEGKSYAHNHSHSIRGTLIHWTVRIADREP